MEFEGRKRVIIENVRPQIDCGRFPVKRVIGEKVVVRADVFTDGHDEVASVLLYRNTKERTWQEIPMKSVGNDRWRKNFDFNFIHFCTLCLNKIGGKIIWQH